jgi:putative transposase
LGATRGVTLEFIQLGKPTQNSHIERFNRTFREEVLDFYVFSRLSEVGDITEDWLKQFNEQRPYEALGNFTPSEYLAVKSPGISTFDWH